MDEIEKTVKAIALEAAKSGATVNITFYIYGSVAGRDVNNDVQEVRNA